MELAEEYVKLIEKSTSPVSTLRKVFEHCVQKDQAGGKRLKIVLKALSINEMVSRLGLEPGALALKRAHHRLETCCLLNGSY